MQAFHGIIVKFRCASFLWEGLVASAWSKISSVQMLQEIIGSNRAMRHKERFSWIFFGFLNLNEYIVIFCIVSSLLLSAGYFLNFGASGSVAKTLFRSKVEWIHLEENVCASLKIFTLRIAQMTKQALSTNPPLRYILLRRQGMQGEWKSGFASCQQMRLSWAVSACCLSTNFLSLYLFSLVISYLHIFFFNDIFRHSQKSCFGIHSI